jgi:hypothetical protein
VEWPATALGAELFWTSDINLYIWRPFKGDLSTLGGVN